MKWKDIWTSLILKYGDEPSLILKYDGMWCALVHSRDRSNLLIIRRCESPLSPNPSKVWVSLIYIFSFSSSLFWFILFRCSFPFHLKLSSAMLPFCMHTTIHTGPSCITKSNKGYLLLFWLSLKLSNDIKEAHTQYSELNMLQLDPGDNGNSSFALMPSATSNMCIPNTS